MGNILTQKRNGGGASATALDELTYNYHTTTDGLVSNRLYQVNDVVSAGNYTDDIDDQGTFNNTHSTIETANNYGYDELGNLVRDAQEEIASIEWTVYGKMKKIIRNSGSSKADLEFGYDASGNRLWKKVTPKGSGAVTSTYYYLRDAQGNEMCRYVKYTNTSSQIMYVAQEHSIYGSSRVGVDNRKDTLYKAGNYSPAWGGANTSRRALGLKSFELSNHLGNVLVTISDKPIYQASSGSIYFNPEITSISDYYPFGAPIAGRSAAFGGEYRFGFNGKEDDDETQTQDYGMRIYNGRLGKFLSVDPLSKQYPSLTPYQFANNTPIVCIDLDGEEGLWYVYAKAGVYGETTAKIVNGTEDGIKASVVGTWNFVTDGAWQAETWKQAGLFLEETILSSSPYSGIYNPSTPRLDAAVKSFEDNVIKGDAYSRSKFIAGATTDLLLGFAGDKGLSKLGTLRVFTTTGKTLMSSSMRFTQNSVNNFSKALAEVKAGTYDPIDIVKMSDGMYSTVDNTRLLAAQQLGVDIKATTHAFDEALPESMLSRFENPNKAGEYATTWGQAVEFRVGSQTGGYAKTYQGTGSFVQPKVNSQ